MAELRTYSEMVTMSSFVDRFDYLRLEGSVGAETFGFDRHINQTFYRSTEWQAVRRHVILRDGECDLAVPGHEVHHGMVIHHINPMTPDDIIHGLDWILDPEFLVVTSHRTHNAIHYGVRDAQPPTYVERRPGDTQLWPRR